MQSTAESQMSGTVSDSLFLFLFQGVLGRVLEDEGVQLVPHVHVGHKAASLALEQDIILSDFDLRLGVAAAVAAHILLDEVLQKLRKLLGVMCSVDDGRATLGVKVCLSSQLAAIELQDICKS
jgi:hypothetical protein